LKQIDKNRNSNKIFEEVTNNNNTPNQFKSAQTKHLSKSEIRSIINFRLIIIGNSLSHERLIYNEYIRRAFQRKSRKENERQFEISI
jgi:hypothetical protein